MFEYLYGLVMGLVQGLTEFLPVSSSGHLVLLKTLFRFEDSGGILFEVVLHLGTLVSIVIYYRKDILNMIREFFNYWTEKNKTQTKMRFEQQPTWETSKRLATWDSKAANFDSKPTKGRNTQPSKKEATERNYDEEF